MAGSGPDPCVAIRTEYNRRKAIRDIAFAGGAALAPIADFELAEFMNMHSMCFH